MDTNRVKRISFPFLFRFSPCALVGHLSLRAPGNTVQGHRSGGQIWRTCHLWPRWWTRWKTCYTSTQTLVEKAKQNIERLLPGELHDPGKIRILSPVPLPAALLDFGLTPEHLANAARTLLKYEFNPVVTPVSGTVIGMGTIPWCCGLDRDSWIRPGDKIEISMESLGCLRQVVPTVYLGNRECRWKARK